MRCFPGPTDSRKYMRDCPFRIIVSSIDSPLYTLATYLHEIPSNNIPIPQSHIDNSFDLVKKLNNTVVNKKFKLILLDVVLLFTNIPLKLAVENFSKRWNIISKHTHITKDGSGTFCSEFYLFQI